MNSEIKTFIQKKKDSLADLYEAGCVFVLARSRNGSHRVFKQPAAERSSQLLFGFRAVHRFSWEVVRFLVASSATLNCWHYSSDYLTKNTEGDRPGDKLFDLRGISCTASTPEKEEIYVSVYEKPEMLSYMCRVGVKGRETERGRGRGRREAHGRNRKKIGFV